jgi:hypothetical protein
MYKVGELFTGIRALLNDTQDAVYHDEIIIPYFKMAYDELKLNLQDYNIPFTNKTSEVITVPAGITDIGGPEGPGLPNDLIEIMGMYERTAGTDNNFLSMTRNIFLPKTEQQIAYLQVYSWQKQYIKLLGATSNIEVKIDYIAEDMTMDPDANTVMVLHNSKLALQYGTAALCAMFIDENESRAAALNSKAVNALDLLLSVAVKSAQSAPVRRRPFLNRWKARGGGYYY